MPERGRGLRVFLSYRRSDVGGYAGRLYDDLGQHLGPKNVFQDVTGIAVGQDFTHVIDRQLDDTDAVLAVVGPGWLTATTDAGARRLEDPDDYVRLELSRTLRRDIPVVPVLVGGARLPTADELPADLAELARRQSVSLRDESWHADIQGLARSLRGEPAVPPPRDRRRDRRRVGVAAAALAVVVLAGAGLWRCTSPDEPLTVPDSVFPGAEFEACWNITDGAPTKKDQLGLYTVESAPSYSGNHLTPVDGKPQGCTKLTAPVTEDPLEVRYQPNGKAEAIATSKPITIKPVAMTLTVPDTVFPGAEFEACWNITDGAPTKKDQLGLYTVESAPSYSGNHLTPVDGKPQGCTKLTAPVTEDPLEVRYQPNGKAEAIATSKPITIKPVAMTLTVPDSVFPGAEFEACWNITDGAPTKKDQLGLYTVESAPSYSGNHLTPVDGKPQGCTKLTAPVTEDPLEVRYQPNGKAEAIATSKPITIKPVAMTLTVPDTVFPGAEFEACWNITDGAPTKKDQLGLYTVESAPSYSGNHLTPVDGKPQGCTKLTAPVTEDPLEVRYQPNGKAEAIATSKPITIQ